VHKELCTPLSAQLPRNRGMEAVAGCTAADAVRRSMHALRHRVGVLREHGDVPFCAICGDVAAGGCALRRYNTGYMVCDDCARIQGAM
jgi:hypothetical protein